MPKVCHGRYTLHAVILAWHTVACVSQLVNYKGESRIAHVTAVICAALQTPSAVRAVLTGRIAEILAYLAAHWQASLVLAHCR